MKTLLDIGMDKLLADHYDDFALSLRGSGIDVATKTWRADAIERNAKWGAEMVVGIASKDRGLGQKFLRVVLGECDWGNDLHAMTLIYTAFDVWAGGPIFGIVQHGIEKDLLREYCVALRKWIAVYAKIKG